MMTSSCSLSTEVARRVNRAFGPVLAGNRLWVANTRGLVASVDVTDGKPTTFTELDNSVSLAPVVANGTLYILDDGGTITAFR